MLYNHPQGCCSTEQAENLLLGLDGVCAAVRLGCQLGCCTLCREAAQTGPAGSEPLAIVPVGQPSAAPSPSEVALVEEVIALKALLASVAPQLQELAGMKQQMGQLLTLLQPATAGQQETLLPCATVLDLTLLTHKTLPVLNVGAV